ncbi:hypothetical protein SCMU_20510 [Sinomonas cyclohexanicum]|uniref:DUF4352 domain-containing protein n=1 Tax=Sinomonas cyclohexanicum TaxID=322009 RepID=A0ABN6FHW7_SINCY|nr:DUF4352 domain-containing protein [Corynebacterium cyclohexanicum]BCT76209.1 hypothetical protein SCMU_20510 [Corynebacterium cyclohexanicum]
MKKIILASTAALALAGSLTACGPTAAGTPTSTPSVAQAAAGEAAPGASAPSSAPAGEKSSRGNLIKKVGEPASQTYNGETVATFVVKSIDAGAACTAQYAQQPKNGQIVVATFDVETTAALAKTITKDFSLNMFGWKAIAGNGTTVNGNIVPFMCLDSAEALPSQMGPGEKATGKIAFDVPAGAGTLVYTAPGAPAGWEWSY